MVGSLPQTGNVSGIVEALNASGFRIVEVKSYDGSTRLDLVLGDDSEIQEMRAEMEAAREGVYNGRERDRILCDFQLRARAQGWCPISLSTNIYGWAAGSQLRANISGGRWAMTSRGDTLEDVIKWAIDYTARCRNAVFSCSLSQLPPELQEAMGV